MAAAGALNGPLGPASGALADRHVPPAPRGVAAGCDGCPGRGRRTAMAFDSQRRQVVLFGGASEPTRLGQPRTFDDDTGSGTAPGGRLPRASLRH